MTSSSETTRTRILRFMARSGRNRIWLRGELACQLGLARPTLDFHVREMLSQGLLEPVTTKKSHIPVRITDKGLGSLEQLCADPTLREGVANGASS